MEAGLNPTTAIVPADDSKLPLPSSKGKKKRGGAMSFIRAALFMWRRRGSGKRSKAAVQIEAATASAAMLNKVVGSMRPLHANSSESPPHMAAAQLEAPPLPGGSPSQSEGFEDVASVSSSYRGSSSDGDMSTYSSALNLQELEKGNGGPDPVADDDRDYDANAGDEMIDAKAEEFIARFYQQMRIQNYDESVHGSARIGW